MSLRDLYAMYHEQIQFLVIYIREAHPMDGIRPGKDHGIYDPTTIEERRGLAVRCEAAMEHGIQTYVDEMDDPVMTAYAARPERLYLVGTDGRIAYQGGKGPKGFIPSELKAAIDGILDMGPPSNR